MKVELWWVVSTEASLPEGSCGSTFASSETTGVALSADMADAAVDRSWSGRSHTSDGSEAGVADLAGRSAGGISFCSDAAIRMTEMH